MAGVYLPLSPRERRASLASYANFLLFCVSMVALLLSSINLGQLVCDEEKAWNILNVPSPITDSLKLPTEPEWLIGELGTPSIWSQPPSPEVDKAWGDMNDHNLAFVSSHDIIAAGKNLSVSVKVPPELGHGDDAYAALFDSKHKIHCLNRVRKDVYFDYYWGDAYPDGKPSDLHKAHTNHCIQILLQSLMCEANTDFIAYAWYNDYDYPHPDFNIQRKCGDFDSVETWMQKHSMRQAEIFDIPKLPGQASMEMTRESLRLVGLQDG